MGQLLDGIIIKSQSGLFTVYTEEGRLVCTLRGRLKKRREETDIAAVGDRVKIMVSTQGSGVIHSVLERKRVLARRANASRHNRTIPFYKDRPLEQVIIANPDQAVFVFSCAQPDPRVGMLDRFLVVSEANKITAIICVNKIDLVANGEARNSFSVYEDLGYSVNYCSARTGDGVQAVREKLTGKISVLSGPSGVGKSSLLNAIQPGLGLAVTSVSSATSKGKHTTVYPQLISLDGGGWVADTPGLRSMALFDIEAEELDGYFVEIAALVADCQFSDCSHVHEIGCAVLDAVDRGDVSPSRYQSYRRMRLGETAE